MFLRDINNQIVSIGDIIAYPAREGSCIKMKKAVVHNVKWFGKKSSIPVIQCANVDVEKVWLTRVDRIVKLG